MKTNLDALISENQSAAIKSKTILHKFSTIRDVTDVSHNLSSSLAWTSFNFCETFRGMFGFYALRKFFLSQICYS